MKILLVCNAGMSTGIMQLKLEEEAKKQNMAASVLAVPMSELEEYIDDTDAVLLGPQIRFAKNDIEKMFPETVPVMVIAAQDFGIMNAKKVLAQLLELLKK